VLIKRGSNELPDLKEHPRRGEHNSDVNAAGDEEGHVPSGVRVDELRVEMSIGQSFHHRLDHQVDEMRRDDPANGGADDNGSEGVDDALAQLNQVLEKRHLSAGLFLGCCERGVRLAAVGHERGREQDREKRRERPGARRRQVSRQPETAEQSRPPSAAQIRQPE